MIEWGQPDGCCTIAHRILEFVKQDQQTQQHYKKKLNKTNVQACKKKLNNGHYTAAICILSSNGVAPCNADTLHELQLKHPQASPPTIPSDDIGVVAVSVDVKAIVKALKSFPKGTSCGRDDLRAQHLLDATSGAAAAIAEDLLKSVTGVVNLWFEG